MPGMVGTWMVLRERGFLNMISWDFDLFNANLSSLTHSCMCSSSRSLVWALDAGDDIDDDGAISKLVTYDLTKTVHPMFSFVSYGQLAMADFFLAQ